MTRPSLCLALLCGLAAPAAAQERSVEQLYQPGDQGVWVFEQAGQRIGQHVFRYEGPVEAFGLRAQRFTARVRLTTRTALGEMEQRYTSELLTDARGRPLRHFLAAQVGGTVSKVELSVENGQARAQVRKGAATQELEVELPEEAYLLANNFIGYLELVFGLDAPAAKGQSDYTLFSTNVLRAVPYQAKWVEAREDGGCLLEDSLGERILLNAEGRIEEIQMPAARLVIRRSDEEPEVFEIGEDETARAIADLRVEPVTINYGEVSLAGEVTTLKAAEGPFPAIFFISGSGTQDRHGFAGGIDVGTHELLDRLTREGFLVLRVDDRGAGASQGPTRDMGYQDLVADARACVEHLLEREDVDPARVALVGHSEGAVTAPILAAERPELAAIVLMAGTARPLPEVIYDQNRWALEQEEGLSAEERAAKLAEAKEFLDQICSDAEIDPAELDADQRGALRMRRWLQDHARHDPIATIRKVRCPVLILQGALDLQVSPEKDAQPLEAALAAAEHPDHRLQVFPRLDHLFKRVEGEPSLSDYALKRPVDAEFLDAISAWLKERLKP